MVQFVFGDYYARHQWFGILMYFNGLYVACNKRGSTFFMSGQDISSYIFYIILGDDCRRSPQLPTFERQDYPDQNILVCTGSQNPDSVGFIGGYYLMVKRSVLAGPVFDTPSSDL
jgi:hypothetical protein